MKRGASGNWATPLSDAALAKGLRALLDDRPESDGLWLFGYGALMWQSHAAFAAVEPVRIADWRRSFCVWSAVSRGTRERPGLGLALRPGGMVEGLALRLPASQFDDEMARIWRQEMYVGLYRPAWLPAKGSGGDDRRVLAFLVRPEHPQFAGDLPAGEQADIIRHAVGENGSCRDYLAQTVAALERWQLRDREMTELLARVDGRGA